jgi:uncharacterized membrane protein
MASLFLLAAFYLISPIVIIYLSQKIRLVNKIGVVVMAYILGIIAGHSGLMPDSSREVQDMLTMLSIPLAIPLILFSANLRQWSHLAGKTVISMLIGLVSVVVMVTAGFLILKNQHIPELWKVGGMLIGVYTGGTPNLASLKLMLDVDEEIYLLTHTYDMLVSAVYLLFLISVGRRVFSLILPPFAAIAGKSEAADDSARPIEDYSGLLQTENLKSLLSALGLSVLIFGISGGASFLIPQVSQIVVVILLITTLGIVSSFIPAVSRLKKSFELGMYFILVFSVAVASMVDVTALSGNTLGVLPYLSFVIFGSLLMHVLLARFFRIDTDTVMITSTAMICSPPFVPVVAGALKNRAIVVSGLTVGIVGYAVGNYLGVAVAELLKYLI